MKLLTVHDVAALAAHADEVPLDEVPALVAELARAQTALLIGLRATPRPVERDLLDAEEAGERLSVTARWLLRHADEFPFTRRLSRKVVRFSATGIEAWLAKAGERRRGR